MPPKKTAKTAVAASGATSKEKLTAQDKSARIEDDAKQDGPKPAPTGKKRKQSDDHKAESTAANKTARRSKRQASKDTSSSQGPSTVQLLNYLLSPDSLSLCRPKDEYEAATSHKLRTYTSSMPLSPFEDLLAACVLSRPISHALGHRTMRTILNDPYNFRTPKAILDAGQDKVHQSLWDARTQHKAKTAEQILGLAKTCRDEGWAASEGDSELSGLRKKIDKDGDAAEQLAGTVKKIKGVGDTAVQIFLRRVQGVWPEVYPFIDGKTGEALEDLGLPGESEELKELFEKEWKNVKLHANMKKGKSDQEARLYAFVLLLEQAIGASLQGHVDNVLYAATTT